MLRVFGWPSTFFPCRTLPPPFCSWIFEETLHLGLLEILFAFLFVDLFDNVGTLVASASKEASSKMARFPVLAEYCWLIP
jgi:xanthine/uracil/vitamin C permease (AzgA family)